MLRRMPPDTGTLLLLQSCPPAVEDVGAPAADEGAGSAGLTTAAAADAAALDCWLLRRLHGARQWGCVQSDQRSASIDGEQLRHPLSPAVEDAPGP